MSDAAPVFLESNRHDAEHCCTIAATALSNNDIERAERFLAKSLRLYPTPQAHAIKERMIQLQHEQSQPPPPQPKPQQPKPQQSTTPPRAAAAPSSSSAASSSSASKPAASNGTAPDASAQARRILSLKSSYYELFGVSKSATDQEIKSSYRKLALKFHPDKNKAPEAEEAFKAIGTAFSCLSDPAKRRHYDLCGEDDGRSSSSSGARQPQHQRGEDLSPEDVFNMFFNGTMNGGGQGGVRQRTYTYRRPARQSNADAESQQPSGIFSQLAHFLPLLLLLLFGILASPGGDDPVFGLSRTPAFSVPRTTHTSSVPYYVTPSFAYKYQRDARALANVEGQVEQQAYASAQDSCTQQKRAQTAEEKHIKKQFKGADLAEKLAKLQSKGLDACDRLNGYKMNAQGGNGGR